MKVYFRIALVLALVALLQFPLLGMGQTATWADVALALDRLNDARRAHPVPAEELAAFSRKVDGALVRHTSGQMKKIVKALDKLTASLESTSGGTPEETADSSTALHAASLKVSLVPRSHMIGSKTPPVATISPLYDAEVAAEGTLILRITLPGDAGAIEVPFDSAAAKEGDLSLTIPLGDNLAPGACPVELVTPGGRAVSKSPWYLITRPLAEVRAANEKRLDKIEAESDVMKQALGACRDRNKLLKEAPAGKKLTAFRTDPVKLMSELDAEIAALEKGLDPFKGRQGDYWRTITVGDGITVPVRVYAPASITEAESLPLMLVFRGPIAAPHMNLESYGAGKLGRLAEEKGFVVAAPAIPLYQAGRQVQRSSIIEDTFRTLFMVLEAEYPIAPDRVFTLGHATGGIHATTTAKKNLDKVSAVCCISSTTLDYSLQEEIPITLLMTGSEDRNSPPNRVEGISIIALAREIPIHYQEIKNHGRVTAAGEGLAAAVDWLLAQETRAGKEE